MVHLHLLSVVVAFALISLASNDVGHFFSKWRLPLITGFLFTGILAGPYALDLVSREATVNLFFVDQVSLAVIAFAAGSELYLKEMRSRLRSIVFHSAGQVLVTFGLGSVAVFLVSSWIPFMATMATSGRVAVSLLIGAILVARSPSSAIAIVNELRAKGPFTATVLGVTVVIDVAVIILFSVCFSIADGVISGSGMNLAATLVLPVELMLSVGIGLGLGWLLDHLLNRTQNTAIRSGLLLLLGYGVFFGSGALHHFSGELLPVSLHLEPLLICMVAAFYVTNFCESRVPFARTLEAVAPAVYVAFFTLVGASLELDVVAATWQVALLLCLVRLVGIFLGSIGAGSLVGDPPKHNRTAWMSYLTQAGVALGLAKGVAAAFPDWGPAFATTCIAVIVVNQVIGPPFFKLAIYMVGEAHPRADAAPFDGVRDAVIFGVEGQSLALARVLHSNGWQVKLACPDPIDPQQVGDMDVFVHPIDTIDLKTLQALEADCADAIVTLLSDEDNWTVCETAYENFGTRVLVARLNERHNLERFRKLGVMVIDPSTAMVNLLDRCVRSPGASSLLLGQDDGVDVVDVEVGNPDVAGLQVRELRLPLDVAILYVHRDGAMLSSTGDTVLRLGDRVTLSGPDDALEQALLKLEPR